MSHLIANLIGFWLQPTPQRDERGLSQSTENAILLAGAIVIAGIVISMVTVYVQKNMPK